MQELVLLHTYEGKTYSEIAATYCYESEYIKTVGCELWQLLSKTFNQQITKANFSQFVRQYIHRTTQQEMLANLIVQEPKLDQKKRQDWGTAPQVSHFVGRSEEINTLIKWAEDEQCQMTIVSGTSGLGKTTLVVKFAEQVQAKFQYVIWRSLHNAPSLDKLIDNLIYFFSDRSSQNSLDTLDSKILKLLAYLDQYRCLLVLDDSNAILDGGEQIGHYRSDYQNYGHFLYSLLTARHQSSIVVIGWEKPKELDPDKQEQICHLTLNPMRQNALQQIFQRRLPTDQPEEQFFSLFDRYADNPKLIKTVISTIKKFFNGSISQFLQQKPTLLEDISEIIDRQFERRPNLEKKIAYLMAINYTPISLEQLQSELTCQSSQLDLLQACKNLQQIGFLSDGDKEYQLSSLAKDYLKSKLLATVYQQIELGN